MDKPLTKLQRIAISYFLTQAVAQNYDVYYHLYEGGIILFNRNLHGGYTMFVRVGLKIYVDNGKYQIKYIDMIIMTLEESEDIDTNIEYNFKYDGYDNMFHLTEIQL